MKETKLINRFSEKDSYLGKWAILGPKIVRHHNSGSPGRIFLKFYTMNEANRKTRIILILFKKKKKLRQMGNFGPIKVHPRNFGSTVRI